MVNLYTKNRVNICKGLEKKTQKTEDGLTDSQKYYSLHNFVAGGIIILLMVNESSYMYVFAMNARTCTLYLKETNNEAQISESTYGKQTDVSRNAKVVYPFSSRHDLQSKPKKAEIGDIVSKYTVKKNSNSKLQI